MDIQVEREVSEDDLIALYDSVGWEAYTRSPETLTKAIANSTIVVTARGEEGELIGLARGQSLMPNAAIPSKSWKKPCIGRKF